MIYADEGPHGGGVVGLLIRCHQNIGMSSGMLLQHILDVEMVFSGATFQYP